MTDRLLCGWRVRSDLPLPELPAWPGNDRLLDIVIRLGPVPEALAEIVARDRHGDIGANGTFLLCESGVGRYLVSDREVTVQAEVETHSPLLRALLYGTILGVLCHRRGLLPLHASCLVRDGRAILLAGARGSGKSTLAAALSRHGFALAADDVTPVTWSGGAMPMALPSLPCLRLTAAAIKSLGLPQTGALDPAYGKIALPGAATPWLTPASIMAIIHLAPDPEATKARLAALSRAEAVGVLYESCFRGRLAHAIGLGAAVFAASTRLATECPAHRLIWRHDTAGHADLARLLGGVRYA